MEKKKEFRSELRFSLDAEQEGRRISGKAISFETISNDIGFREILHKGCITQETIDNSNIVFTVNHDPNAVLAKRSKDGKGSLNIELKDDGVYFDFTMPNTQLGNDTLEQMRRGDISECSFAFSYGTGKDAYVDSYDRENQYWTRDVYSIEKIWDCSCVYVPAYSDTYILARNEELAKMNNTLEEKEEKRAEECPKSPSEAQEEARAEEEIETKAEEEKAQESESNEAEEKEERAEAPEEKEETKEESAEAETEEKEEKPEEKEEAEERSEINNNIKTNTTKMKQEFSIIKALRSLVNGEQMDEVTSAVINAGREEMKNAGISGVRGIVIPSAEYRAAWPTANTVAGTVTVATEGADVVDVDIKDILLPLHENSVLNQVGVTVYSGLKGDVQIPRMSAGQAGWVGEIASADLTDVTFDNVKLSPKRISAYLEISKQMLEQDSHSVEANIRAELMKAINSVLERTLWSADAATSTKPAGLFNGKTLKSVATYKDLLVNEADMKEANVFGDLKYVIAPKAEADLKFMSKSSKSTQLVMEDGKVDGTQAYTTSFLKNHKVVYGDFGAIAVGFWGGVELIADQYGQLAIDGKIRLIANCYVDFAVVRDEALTFATTAADEVGA